MSASVTCLFGLIGWAIALMFVVLGARGHAIFGQGNMKERLDFSCALFDQQGGDLAPLGRRITRAERNSLEWLVIPASLLLYGIATGQSEVTDGLAMVVLCSRVLQSLTHIISTATPAILVRATLFTVQVVIWAIWALGFYSAA